MRKCIGAFIIAGTALAVFACGGGGGGNPGGGDGVSLSGIAATGTALTSASVVIKDGSGKKAAGTTDGYGKFTIDATGLEAPFIVRVQKNTTVLVSYCSSLGNVNVTPLTTQVMSFAYGRDVAALSIDELAIPTADQLTAMEGYAAKYIALLKKVCESDEGLAGLLTDFNLFTSSFNASGTGFDMILDLVQVEVNDYTDTDVTITVETTAGPVSVDVDTSAVASADFTSIASALEAAAEAQKKEYGKKVFFIVLDTEDASKCGIYSMWTDGSGLDQITPTTPSGFFGLSVFQDGSAFYMIDSGVTDTTAEGNVNKYSAGDGSLQGSAVIQKCGGLSFSHDGNKLAALLFDENGDSALYFLTKSTDGTSLVSTKLPSGNLYPYGWSWGQDNATLYFAGINEVSEDSHTSDIYKLTTSSKTNLTNTPNIIKGCPAVSFDGQKIAYLVHTGDDKGSSSSDEDSTSETFLYVGDLGTSSITGVKMIVGSTMVPESPVWTPEGKILFLGLDTDDKRYIYSINSDGTGKKKLSSLGMVHMMDVQP